MPDLRSSATIMEDVATAGGRPLHAAVEGDAASGKNAHGVLGFKDPSGNMAYAKVNAARQIEVSFEQGDATRLAGHGTTAGNAAYQDVATITLATSKTYRNLGFLAACYRDAEFQVVSVDNGVATVQALGLLVGQGDLSAHGQMPSFTFASGATGAQTLKLQAKNQNTLSDFRGTITIDEIEQVP